MSTPESPVQSPETQPESQSQSEEGPSHSHTRNGKVARLPKTLRDEVNQMLLDHVPFAKIIENLGEAGSHITESNIGNWKSGGFQDWLRDQERNDALNTTRDAALDLVKQKAGATVQDAGRTIASAQLYELLLSFDPRAFAQALAEKPELYFRLINALSRLSEGEATCGRRRAELGQGNPVLAESGNGQNVVAADTLKEIARLIKLL